MSSIPWHPVRRALPRVLGVIIGLILMRRYPDQWISWAGWAVFVFSVVGAAAHPVAWWRYVMTGAIPTPPEPKDARPGAYLVRLESAGRRPIEVVKTLREVSEVGLVKAKESVDNPPAVIAEGLSEDYAAQVRARVERAGGTASVVAET